MKTRLSLAALLAAFLSLPVAADKPAGKLENKPADKPVVVPFEMLSSGHMAVKVKVNGKGPFKLIFDTGAPVVLLNNRVAREAKLLDGSRPAFSLFNAAGEAQVKKLAVGTVEAENVKAVVMDHPLVEAMSRKLGPIDGIVGFPFFARFRMTIDYQAKTLSFVKGKYRPGDVMQELQGELAGRLFSGAPRPRQLAPAAQWGLVAVKKPEDDEPGVTVREVLAGSPAARAGIKAGDRLLSIDDRWTDSLEDLFTVTGLVKPGTSVPVQVERDGKEMTLTAKPVAGM